MSIKNIFNRVFGEKKDSLSNDSTSEQTATPSAGALGELGVDKLKALITQVTAAFPIFEKAGFEVEEVHVEIGNNPKLMPRFRHLKDISEEEQKLLLNEVKDLQLIKFILVSLFKSSNMKHLINDPKLRFDAIEIDLTSTPSVRGVFKAIENSDRVVRLERND